MSGKLIIVQLFELQVVSKNPSLALKNIPNKSRALHATNLLNQVPHLLPFVLGHHPLKTAVIAGHVNAELFITNLSLHGAPCLMHLYLTSLPNTSLALQSS